MARRAAEKHRRLARGITASDDDRLQVFAVSRLVLRRSVIDAGSLKLSQPVDRRTAILNTGRDNDGPAADALAVVEGGAETIAERLQLRHTSWNDETGTELHRLDL